MFLIWKPPNILLAFALYLGGEIRPIQGASGRILTLPCTENTSPVIMKSPRKNEFRRVLIKVPSIDAPRQAGFGDATKTEKADNPSPISACSIFPIFCESYLTYTFQKFTGWLGWSVGP